MRLSPLLSRISLFTSLPALAFALVAIFGVRSGVFSLTLGMQLMLPAVALGLIGFVTGAAWTWQALKANDSSGWRTGATGLAIAFLVLAPVANEQIRQLTSPPLVDITTDPGTPPEFVALLALRAGAENSPAYDGDRELVYEGKTTNALAVQKKAYPDLKPLSVLLPPPKPCTGYPCDLRAPPASVMFWRAFETAKRMGWQIVLSDEKAGRIEATDSSLFFGTVDDIAINVRASGKTGARVNIRSKSRMGSNDAGGNANRIRAFFKAIPR